MYYTPRKRLPGGDISATPQWAKQRASRGSRVVPRPVGGKELGVLEQQRGGQSGH